MTETQLAKVRRIEYEGKDGDCLLFSTKSWTGRDVSHFITADFASGLITCTCEDGRIRKKCIDILTGEGNSCKHIQACQMLCKHILEQRNEADTA